MSKGGIGVPCTIEIGNERRFKAYYARKMKKWNGTDNTSKTVRCQRKDKDGNIIEEYTERSKKFQHKKPKNHRKKRSKKGQNNGKSRN